MLFRSRGRGGAPANNAEPAHMQNQTLAGVFVNRERISTNALDRLASRKPGRGRCTGGTSRWLEGGKKIWSSVVSASSATDRRLATSRQVTYSITEPNTCPG